MLTDHEGEKAINRVTEKLYPESRLTGFPRDDYIVTFWSQVNALLRPEMTILDFGAGRGKWANETNDFRRHLLILKGRCRKLVGADLDEAVRENSLLDESVVLLPDEALPFEDASFDMIVSWAVFEHIADPELYAGELARVLKPGGFLCAWTPNKWGYVGMGARFIPNRFHKFIISRVLQSGRDEADIFPTTYRLNTRGQIRRRFPDSEFDNGSYVFAGPPGYHGGSLLVARFWKLFNWLMPAALGPYLYVFLRKRKV